VTNGRFGATPLEAQCLHSRRRWKSRMLQGDDKSQTRNKLILGISYAQHVHVSFSRWLRCLSNPPVKGKTLTVCSQKTLSH
jgi:hypothetical protein